MKEKVKKETSCGAVVHREEKGKRLFLLLHYPAGHWDFPKGYVEKGETVQACAARETKEETGITDLEFTPGFEETIHYFFKENNTLISKEVVYVIARTTTAQVTISYEHTGHEWLLYNKALKRLTYQNSKDVLNKAEKFLNTPRSPP